jgi:hypothetical protein
MFFIPAKPERYVHSGETGSPRHRSITPTRVPASFRAKGKFCGAFGTIFTRTGPTGCRKSESAGKRSDRRANRTIRDESGVRVVPRHQRRAGRAGRSKPWRPRRKRGHLGRRANRSNQVAAIVASLAEPPLPCRSRRAQQLKSPATTRQFPSTKYGRNPRLCVPARLRHRQVQSFPAPNGRNSNTDQSIQGRKPAGGAAFFSSVHGRNKPVSLGSIHFSRAENWFLGCNPERVEPTDFPSMGIPNSGSYLRHIRRGKKGTSSMASLYNQHFDRPPIIDATQSDLSLFGRRT